MTAREIIDCGNWNTAVELMDEDIRIELHEEMAPCTKEEFLEEYMKRHFDKYKENFTI